MVLIGLGHKCRQGKNTVADVMKAQNNQIKLYAFADELKMYCKEHHKQLVHQWSEDINTHNIRSLNPPKDDPIYGYTQILQWYGTDVARKSDPDTWIKALEARLRLEVPSVAVITDVRFPNEAAYVKEKGGYMVNVIRLNKDGSQFLDAGRDPNHPSEVALDDYEGYDFTIEVKDGNFEDLRRKAIGVWNLVDPNSKYDIPEYVDEPDYGSIIASFVEADDDGTGFKS